MCMQHQIINIVINSPSLPTLAASPITQARDAPAITDVIITPIRSLSKANIPRNFP